MNIFQIVTLAFVGCLMVSTVVAMFRTALTRWGGLAWLMLWLVTGLSIASPSTTGRIAQAVGIGRGADLVLYCAVVVMMVGFLMVYVRLRRLRREVTLLVRHLAIQNATGPSADTSAVSPEEF